MSRKRRGAGKGRKRHKRKSCRPEEKRNRFFPPTFKGVNISVFGEGGGEGGEGDRIRNQSEIGEKHIKPRASLQ